jgi:hypothetical protein
MKDGVLKWTKIITPVTNVADVVARDAIMHPHAQTTRSARPFRPLRLKRRRSANHKRLSRIPVFKMWPDLSGKERAPREAVRVSRSCK